METGDLRRQIVGWNLVLGQNFGLSEKDGAIAVFITGEAEGKFLISAATEFKIPADGDFLELNGQGHGA